MNNRARAPPSPSPNPDLPPTTKDRIEGGACGKQRTLGDRIQFGQRRVQAARSFLSTLCSGLPMVANQGGGLRAARSVLRFSADLEVAHGHRGERVGPHLAPTGRLRVHTLPSSPETVRRGTLDVLPQSRILG